MNIKSSSLKSVTQFQPPARFASFLTSLLVLLSVPTGWAQSGTWTNLAGGSWAAPLGWNNGVIADGTDNTANFGTLNLAANATVTLDGARTIGNLVFSDTTATYFNWALNTGSAGPLTLAVSSGTSTITVNNGAATLGVVVAGTGGFVKNGAGGLTLSSANTYSGNTTNTAGTLTLGNINALGAGDLVLANNTVLGCSADLSAGVTNAVRLAGNATISATASQMKMSGAISGPGALTTAGASILTLAAVNTYGGTTTNTAAALTLNGPGVSLPGDLYINGGVVQLGAAGQIADTAIMTFGTSGTLKFWLNGFNETIGGLQGPSGANVRLVVPADTGVGGKPATLTLDVAGANAYNFNSYLADGTAGTSPLSITKSGTGTQTFSGASALVTYTGPTVINGGVLEFSGASSVANSSAITLAGGSVKFSGGGTRSATITGTGNLINAGTTLTLSGNNSYAGYTTNAVGTLTLGNINALGASTLVLANTTALANSVNLSAGVTNAVQLAGNTTISATGNQLKMTGTISGPGPLTTAGTSILTLAAVNTYSGATTNTAAALTLNAPGISLPGDLYINGGVVQLGAAGQIADTAIMTFGTSGTLKFWLNGFNETIGGLQDSGGASTRLVVPADTGVASKPATLTLDVSGANAYNFSGYLASGVVAGDTSPLSITKNGTGTQTFSGGTTLVTYTGPTVINGGVLEFSGASSVGNNSAITLAGGSVKFSGGGARSAAITGTGNLINAGASTLFLSGNNSYAGYTTNAAGMLALGHVNALGTSTLVLVSNTVLGVSTSLFAGVGVTNAIVLAADSTIANGNNNMTLSGVISGSGALTKNGAGWLQMLGNNTYAGSTTISNGVLLVSGSISTGAVVVKTPSTLAGSGFIGGAVTVEADSYLKTGLAGSDIATLTITNTLNLAGETRLNLNRTNVQTASRLSGITTLTRGGTLIVTNVGPDLQANDTFILFSAASDGAGNFSGTNLPALSAGLNWWTTDNYKTILVNAAPTNSAIAIGTLSGTPATVQIIGGKHAPTGDVGEILTVTAVATPVDGTATTDGTNITYTPTGAYTGTNSFDYVVGDGRGGFATNTITAVVITNGAGYNLISATVNGGGDAVLQYAGIPTFVYALEWAHDLALPIAWTPILTNMASTNGLLNFTNTPSGSNDFYRTRYVP